MSYQWCSEVIFILIVMSTLGILSYLITRVTLKFLMFMYDHIRDYTEEVLEDIKYHRRG